MGFFDKFGKAISDVSQTTIQKGKDVANIAKFNRMISDEEKLISKTFEQLGEKYFELHADDGEEAFSEFIDCVKESKTKIFDLEETIKELQGIIKCEQCGNDVPNGAAFCPECGAAISRMEHVEEEHLDPTKCYCPECKAEVEPGTKFCIVCGARLPDPVQFEQSQEMDEEAAETEE